MKAKLFVGLVLLLVGSTAAISLPEADELQEFKQVYNNQSDEVPGFVGKIVGNEKVNFRLETNSSNETLGVEFDGVEISNISGDGFENPTLEVRTDEKTVKEIMNSGNKYSVLQKKLDNGDIEYEASTTGAKIKVAIFDTIRNLAGLIGIEL